MDKQWLELGRELGLTGQDLFNFIKEREDAARDDRSAAREDMAAAREDRQKQLDILDKQIALEMLRRKTREIGQIYLVMSLAIVQLNPLSCLISLMAKIIWTLIWSDLKGTLQIKGGQLLLGPLT